MNTTISTADYLRALCHWQKRQVQPRWISHPSRQLIAMYADEQLDQALWNVTAFGLEQYRPTL